MTIELDQTEMQKAVASAVSSAIATGVSSWEMKHEVEQVAKQAILAVNLPTMLHDELGRRLAEQAPLIVRAVADETLPMVATAFREAFRSALVAMVFGLRRGRPSYMSADEESLWADAASDFAAEASRALTEKT